MFLTSCFLGGFLRAELLEIPVLDLLLIIFEASVALLGGLFTPEVFDIPVFDLLLTIVEAPVGLLGRLRPLRPVPVR